MSKINSQIIGTGFYVPNNVIKNQYFTNFMDTSDKWIRTRTGIEERRFVNDQSGPSDLALQASEMALNNAHMSSKDIDFIIFATSTPDYYVPGSGCLLQEKMEFAVASIRSPSGMTLAGKHEAGVLSIGAMANSEQIAGSDFSLLQTEAKEVDGGFILNGSKI